MIEKLDFLVRFWELRARHATLGQPLGPQEQVELLSLLQLVVGDTVLPLAGPVGRPRNSLPAQLIGDGTMRTVEIRSVNAAALVLTSSTPMPIGAQVIIRTADAVSGVEYALPCRVMWIHGAAPCTIAVTVDGIPTRSVFGLTNDTHVHGALLGKTQRLVG